VLHLTLSGQISGLAAHADEMVSPTSGLKSPMWETSQVDVTQDIMAR
jgi:hypothetical protein